MQEIIDNAVADLRSRVEQSNQEAFDAVDKAVADWKAQLEETTQSNLDRIQDWIDAAHSRIQDRVGGDESVENDDFVSLASVVPTNEKQSHSSHKAMYGYGALTLGAAATMAYFLKRRQNKTLQEQSENLLGDEDYVQV